MTKHLTYIFALAAVGLAACDRNNRLEAAGAEHVPTRNADSIARARQDSINRAQPGYIIDSLLPIDEEIRRFSVTIGGERVTALRNASRSRDSLYARFVRALERSDTSAFRAMLVSPREFIDLIYPESPYTHPPYRQSPRIRWGLMEMGSSQGLTRLMTRRGGKPLGALGMECPTPPARNGKSTLWNDCVVRVRQADGSETREQLFGSIVERGGLFKFYSYANQY
ncbi:MAG TPA: hypothetical protein VJR92_09105 [Gemmatimonadaceae bacterium]|nr:hypothetical protein [Gemmatimonadaceae bacterium]